jgi:hypothetical protein
MRIYFYIDRRCIIGLIMTFLTTQNLVLPYPTQLVMKNSLAGNLHLGILDHP